MERDYAASSAMAYAQQQRQAANAQQQQQQQPYGYPPQHPQFPQHALPPSMPPHPPPQQFPYSQQFPPHLHPQQHPHLPYHQQQQMQPPQLFPPHLPPHLPQPPFHGHYDAPNPPPAPPPSDPELLKRIEKTLEYALKNGPEFEAMIREKQRDNPDYSFLFGGEGYNYYQYKLFISTRPPGGPFSAQYPSMMPMMHSTPNPMMSSPSVMNSASTVPAPVMGGPTMHPHPFPPFYEQQQQQHQHPFASQAGSEYDRSSKIYKCPPGLLPADVLAELTSILNNLNGTKESIKGAKAWFMQRSSFAPAMAEALKERLFQENDSEKQLYIIYLVNDILFDSLQRRKNPHELDNEALAFKPVLGTMLAVVYHNPSNKEDNQSRLQKILQFWASKEVYDQNTIYGLEGEMLSGPPLHFQNAPHSSAAASSMISGIPQQTPQWQIDKQSSISTYSDQDHSSRQQGNVFQTTTHQPLPNQQFLPSSMHGNTFPGSLPFPATQQPIPSMLQTPASTIGEKPPPYPLFPPGLIPGMVRKMQIGSGVPYSPLSPLDIPTVIPPSNVSPAEILERVSKFFKEIGEVNPSEGPLRQPGSKDDEDDYEYKRDSPVRKGGACIPPPSNLQQADPETGTYPDGTVEQKPGSTTSGRLGLGATANPNEVSQYDDVYSSYRKHRSTNYHSSMTARATTK